MLIALIGGPISAADDASPGIVVNGAGEALAKPDTLEIDIVATADAELMSDATTMYDGALRRINGALKGLDLDGLKVEQRGIRITNRTPGGGGGGVAALVAAAGNQPATKTHTGISRSLRLVLPKIDQQSETQVMSAIGKMLDAAKDAGASVGGGSSAGGIMAMMQQGQSDSPVVTFVVQNPQAAREQAYRQAFDDASRRAARLASLAGANLGRVLAIDESAPPPADEKGLQEIMLAEVYGIGKTKSAEGRLTSNTLEDIPVRVSLRVRFALEEQPAHATLKEAAEK
ncbi:MAG TPA: SIMPL domain-containing protein [Pirellulales bacterium]|nr:SIMPL domain-containing protein [Pirellulales bacterium]